MGLHVTVADRLEPLADRLAGALDVARVDPFERPLVVIPSDGVRSWLVAHLAHRLGIVANVQFVFPGQLIGRVLADEPLSASWEVGPLTWAVHHLRSSRDGDEQPDLMASRAIADRFDRYALHRPAMVHAWERGLDLDGTGQPLPEDQRWQPDLWRRLVARLGSTSNVGVWNRAADRLRSGDLAPDVPAEVHVFGLTGLPSPHLELLAALGAVRSVHWWVPAPTLPLWDAVAALGAGLDDDPLPRASDPSAQVVQHPLARSWTTAARESLLLLACAAARHGADISVLRDAGHNVAPGPLGALQHAIRRDLEPPSAPSTPAPADESEFEPARRSVVWHRCHGPARQAEVLREELLHLFDETTPEGQRRFEPRDIVVLCPDLPTFAPLVQAAFAGDPDRQMPSIPLRVADRSLRRDVPLIDAMAALLELVFFADGRFRASEILGLLDHPPVRRRFDLSATEVGQLADWIEQVNIRWGLDHRSHDAVGLPPETAPFTWQAGLDRLLLGAALPDGGPRLGPGGAVPQAGIEGDAVVTLGKVADLLHVVTLARDRLTAPAPPPDWCRTAGEVAHLMLDVEPDDEWHWDLLHRHLDAIAENAQRGGWPDDQAVTTDQLAALVVAGADGLPGRARFGTGAVTLSSLVALRGVPHRVVCLLGLDADVATSGVPAADDLLAMSPHVGDRDTARELRAAMLDAVLAAGERLIVLSTGRDVQTNAELPPAVPVAELMDAVDAAVVDHPRQAWTEQNFRPGALGRPGPFSHDAGALLAAQRRRAPRADADRFADAGPEDLREWSLDSLIRAVEHPIRALLADRLGIQLPGDAASQDDLVPVTLDALTAWQVKHRLLEACVAAAAWDDDAFRAWEAVERQAGNLPPLAFGDQVLKDASELVERLVATARSLGVELETPATTAGIDLSISVAGSGSRRVHGEVAGVMGDTLLVLTPSRLSGKHLLAAWIRLAALGLAWPDADLTAAVIGRRDSPKKDQSPVTWHRLRLRQPTGALDSLRVALDLAERARRSITPCPAATSWAWFTGGEQAAGTSWKRHGGGGDRDDLWMVHALGPLEFDDLLEIAPLDDEEGPEWGKHPSRFVRWSTRLWSAFSACVNHDTDDRAAPAGASDDD